MGVKSALLVGQHENLFALIADELATADDAEIVGKHAQVNRDGALALFYEYPGDDWREPPIPGLESSALTAVMLECRSEELVADLFRDLAAVIEGLRLVDAADVVWEGSTIDATRLAL